MNFKNFTFSAKHQLILLVLLALVLNFNTVFNGYALDDGIVMTENRLVEKGIKGIPEILTTNLFHGFKDSTFELSEPRYRPFSLVIFAIVYQFFGANPMVSHLLNVLLFALMITLLFKLLQACIFREHHKQLAFITCLLYVVHPIHTEVIANVKSGDELITFLLLIASLIMLIRYNEKNTISNLIIGLICFFLALLTRESAVTFIAVVPLIFYFFFNRSVKQSLLFTIPLIVVTGFYLLLRFMIIGNIHSSETLNVLNSPFFNATASEAFATKVFILLKYLGLLLFPHPLSWDYGYNQIPYIDVNSFKFTLSFIVMLSLIAYAVYTFKKKSLFSFCILYFMVSISLVSNFVVDVGTPFSERFLFQPSLAFCMALAVFYIKSEKWSKVVTRSVLLIVLFLFSVKTISRNRVWKNSETLVLTDVISVPNSLRMNQKALEYYILKGNAETQTEYRKEFFKKAVYHGERAIQIYPNDPVFYMELGSAYMGLGDYYKTADLWMQTYKMIPNDPNATYWLVYLSDIFNKQGNLLYERGQIEEAVKYYKKSTELDSKNVESWYNLGGMCFLINDTINANEAWKNVSRLNAKHRFNKDEFYK